MGAGRRIRGGAGASVASAGGAHPRPGHPGMTPPRPDLPAEPAGEHITERQIPAPPTSRRSSAAPHAAAAAPHAAAPAHPATQHHAHHQAHAHQHHGGDSDHVGLVSLDGPDLEDAAAGMRRWADELDAIAARTGTIRGALGIASIQAGVDDIVGREVAELTGLAGELRDEASELTIRAQLARDDLSSPAAGAGTGGVAAPAPPADVGQAPRRASSSASGTRSTA